MRLAPCPGCDRHVLIDAETCPFCGEATAPGPTPSSPTGRLGRAALFAFGAAVASAGLSACSDSHGPTDDAGTARDAGFDAGEAVVPPYGAPPEDAGGPVPLYGGAPED